MDRQRRNFLGLLGLGALALGGCNSIRSGGEWVRVDRNSSPANGANAAAGTGAPPADNGIGEDYPRAEYKPIDWSALEVPKAVTNIAVLDHAIGREVWADAKPNLERLKPMTSPDKITVHHTGMLCTATAKSDIIDLLRDFRRHHVKAFDAGDIGYHYVIDRNGSLWVGRELKFQGAHVKEHNPGNIGVVTMGNFEDQQPTTAQLDTLYQVIPALMKRYDIGMRQVFTHRELGNTLCPGRNLQGKFDSMRRANFA